MKTFISELNIKLNANNDIKDITNFLEDKVVESGIKNGILNVFSVGSTASLTTIEFEHGVINDLKRAIERIIPQNISYEHDRAWHDGNGHSHVQAALLGPSLTIPVKNRRLTLGTWQQVVIINHDVRPRNRKIQITIIGE